MTDDDEMIARDCYVEYMRDDSDDAHGDFLRVVGKAIAAAREEGRAAGIEEAAKLLKEREEGHYLNIKHHGRRRDERAEAISVQLAAECAITGDAIRALKPADKEEP